MAVANIAFLVIGLGGAKIFARITLIPRTFLWPMVFGFSMVGAYSISGSFIDVWVMLISGAVGFLMRRHGFGAAPLVMGLILGKMLEETLSQFMVVYDNKWWRLFESPIVNGFFALTILSLAWPLISARRDRAKG